MSSPVLLVERTGSVVVATLNRPDKGNALNTAMVEALGSLVEELESSFPKDDAARALVLTGAGEKSFSAGADVRDLDGIDSATAQRQMRRGQAAFGALEALPIAVIAAVNGFALGGGLELAMAADIRIASPTAKLGQPEINLGNIPGWGGTQRLPRLIGVARATELILTGELISAQDALEIGLVNRVSDDPLKATMDFADRIAQRNPVAVRTAKQAIRVGLEAGPAAGLVIEAEGVAACCATPAQRAAVRAFLDRKK
jgi:enoyl-CoA hydratase/carnithine racemase